jgi:site-specific DNA-methyltransferase (adenine-specific)
MSGQLYFGDNLEVLRSGAIAPESVELIYLDPPFNSNANYSVLFREPEGGQSQAQIQAFEDTWQWGIEAENAYEDVLNGSNQSLGKLLHALRDALGDNSMMAYLAMMAVRLVELHRVLKPTGSLYLHCDPTASHYLKAILDAVFGPENFRNEITWKRTTTHSDSKTWSRVADTILFYTKSKNFTWNTPREAHSEDYVRSKYRHDDGDGRGLYRLDNMTSPNPRPKMMYEWLGFPSPQMGWRYQRETMQRLHEEGRVWYPRDKSGELDPTRRPQLKRYLSEMEGGVMGTIWTDIAPINSQAQERLGYPTQKPVALLERIIAASSNEGDTVLDPFCGCGTTIHAAERLGRNWIGIDVTHLAISLIENRLEGAFPNARYEIHGTPKDFAGAEALAEQDKHQFEWWALSLVKAQPANDKKKGADKGVDGLLWLRVGQRERAKVIVSVKGGANINVAMVRDLGHVIQREEAAIGLFVTLHEPTGPMKAEAVKAGFYEWEGQRFPRIQILTVESLLNGVKPELPLIDYAAMAKQAPLDRKSADQARLF